MFFFLKHGVLTATTAILQTRGVHGNGNSHGSGIPMKESHGNGKSFWATDGNGNWNNFMGMGCTCKKSFCI